MCMYGFISMCSCVVMYGCVYLFVFVCVYLFAYVCAASQAAGNVSFMQDIAEINTNIGNIQMDTAQRVGSAQARGEREAGTRTRGKEGAVTRLS